ncbi:hypothetical protein [Aliivibrio logei]|uniref:HNH endonuclease n=1 Tax=Aliivibrio logei 5S-186 TaxID=626086 RepID=A0ABX3B0W3_ALILO|nr:hypothetical protein [Aliivibrio logei]OEF23108.1 hypothetical protein A1Q5_00340 [Aliivibrio logei 5S-186]
MSHYSLIDIPFNLRHVCWFCGEPSFDLLSFPKATHQIRQITHQGIDLPACKECLSLPAAGVSESIWSFRDKIKHDLMNKYAKHLGIGLQWTEAELAESEFDGAILEGFGKSAWPMYEIAKARVEYTGWDLTIDNEALDGYDESSGYEFDGIRYLSIQTCIEHHVKALSLDLVLLETLVEIVGSDRFGYALKIAKFNREISSRDRNTIINEILTQEQDKLDIQELEQLKQTTHTLPLVPVSVDGSIAQPEAIEWAIKNNCVSLTLLIEQEDEFFDEFEHLGGPMAFALFDGLQLYLNARANTQWIQDNDPNAELWNEYVIR